MRAKLWFGGTILMKERILVMKKFIVHMIIGLAFSPAAFATTDSTRSLYCLFGTTGLGKDDPTEILPLLSVEVPLAETGALTSEAEIVHGGGTIHWVRINWVYLPGAVPPWVNPLNTVDKRIFAPVAVNASLPGEQFNFTLRGLQISVSSAPLKSKIRYFEEDDFLKATAFGDSDFAGGCDVILRPKMAKLPALPGPIRDE